MHPMLVLAILATFSLASTPLLAEEYVYADSWGDAGLTLTREGPGSVEISFSLASWQLGELELEGRTLRTVQIPGVILPNDAGAPDLPGQGRFIAIPNGATVSFRILDSRTETLKDVEIAPAPRIPLESEEGPLDYDWNESIYSRNAYYPENPVMLSPLQTVRGVQSTVLGITPFQYNPVTKELVVYRDLKIEVSFRGGTGQFGDERLRSPWWDPILADLFINAGSLPEVDYSSRMNTRTDEFEYVIICQPDADFVAWAETLKCWREEQGIRTGVVTVDQIGGNTTTAIETYINTAYTTWATPPSAVLLLGDYGTGSSGIIAPTYGTGVLSDNIYADVDGDQLPDVILARITAQDEDDLTTMIGKMLNYEQEPPTDPGFYDHPIMAGGWQTERWFILCEEVLYGYFANVLGKDPVREYAIYAGTPGSVWSTATNTATVVSYFGPSGLGYIPSTPAHLTDWGGNATRINNDINSGAFILQHRDHGSTSGWGEPAYNTSSLTGLHNEELTFVFSINCLTGAYGIAGTCFAEAFHRHAQGALGIIAASETSYSFVNDTYVWGMYDFMWPDFDPGYGVPGNTNVLPAFANAYGKYYLEASSWPYNTSSKEITYHLFHHHGDAFMTVYSELPQDLTVAHASALMSGIDYFTVTADAGSWIGLSVDGTCIGAGAGTGAPVNIPITPQTPGSNLLVTVTKQDYYRYSQEVPIAPPSGPYVLYDSHVIDDSAGNGDGIPDEGETVNVFVTVQNVGSQTAVDVVGYLLCSDPFVTILEPTCIFPDVLPGSSASAGSPFTVAVAGDIPDGHEVSFTLQITASEINWESNFAFSAQAPVLVAGTCTINDVPGGNGDGNANAGETVLFNVKLTNTGHSDTDDLTGTISCADGNVVIHDDAGHGQGILVSGEGSLGTYEVEFLPTCPEPSNIAFHLEVVGANGFTAGIDFEVPVGGWLDDFEAGRGWIVGAPDDDATTGIWERVDPNGTEYSGYPIQPEDDHTTDPGILCFVTGNGTPGGAAGENDVDNGKTTLFTPVFDLNGAISATVTYWRWYSNDWGGSPGEDWWDVEVTANGDDWVSLEHTQTTAAVWTQQTFDLGSYISLTDYVQIRYVAADEGGGSLVEAGVDDFLLTVVRPVMTDVEEVTLQLPTKLALGANFPNPFRSGTTFGIDLPRPTKVKVTVYDISGRRVATLVSKGLDAGHHEVQWLGRDQSGRRVASGVYFGRLEAEGQILTRKMLLLK
jgi:hypothetical protein